jgi:hypothetical protein
MPALLIMDPSSTYFFICAHPFPWPPLLQAPQWKLARITAIFSLTGGMLSTSFGFSAYPKISAAMRVTAYRIPVDYTDEYLCIGKDSTLKCVRFFVKTLIYVFEDEYPRTPNEEDTKRLIAVNKAMG